MVYPPVLVFSKAAFAHVVRVHTSAAARWDFSTGWIGGHCDQLAVDEMMEAGLCT